MTITSIPRSTPGAASLVRLLVLVAMLPAAVGCRNRSATPSTPASATIAVTSPASPSTTSVASVSTTTEIKRPDGTVALKIANGSDGQIEIRFSTNGAETVMRGESRESGKRKYKIGNGPVVFEVKPEGSGFKLRMADGALRWKVKVSSDKIKISDNNENDKAFELAILGTQINVSAPDNHPLGIVTFDRGHGRSIVKNAAGRDLYAIDGPSFSPAYAVLPLDAIPETQRDILVAELLAHPGS